MKNIPKLKAMDISAGDKSVAPWYWLVDKKSSILTTSKDLFFINIFKQFFLMLVNLFPTPLNTPYSVASENRLLHCLHVIYFNMRSH